MSDSDQPVIATERIKVEGGSGGIPLDLWSGGRATKELQLAIEDFNAQATRQSRSMLRLTAVMAVLTVILLIVAVVQVVLMLRSLGF